MSGTFQTRWRSLRYGRNLGARAIRGSVLTIMGYGGSQFLRLLSNLVLTRLLYPEAFGLMSLVLIFMVGLVMFSDLGIGASILQNKRGDDPDFLNTAWTIQVMRGIILWLATWAMAGPAATFYQAPQLAELLPVVGLTLLIAGFNPTRLETARRHLMLGRVTLIDLVAQVIGLTVGVVVAWITGSIWALVINALVAVLMQLLMYSLYLPGLRNRFRWEKQAVRELASFGSWIFFSTIAGFMLSQGDKIVFGKYLSLNALGIYNIGFYFASFPLLLGSMVTRRILIPVYRESPPSESLENFKKLQKLRFLLTAGLLTILFTLAFLGNTLVQVLYDSRYVLSGGVVVLVAVMQIPLVITLTYDQAALAAGDSRRFFVLASLRAAFMLAGLLIGIELFGLMGALVGQGVAMLLAYPVVVWLARHQGSWDPLHDGFFTAFSVVIGGAALWVNKQAIFALVALNLP